MATVTELATGQITLSDSLTVELHRSIEAPPAVLLVWPAAPSVTDPHRFGAVANAVVAIMAEARAVLARHQAREM